VTAVVHRCCQRARRCPSPGAAPRDCRTRILRTLVERSFRCSAVTRRALWARCGQNLSALFRPRSPSPFRRLHGSGTSASRARPPRTSRSDAQEVSSTLVQSTARRLHRVPVASSCITAR